MNKILTISIAAYNMEKYIAETLGSIVIPEIIDDIEVFVVDDGGKDGTMDIAKRYQEKYPNSVHLVYKENGGYGSTVNYSIAHATGTYFKLLDGDDWFEKDGLIQLISVLKSTDADVVVTPMKRGSDSGHLTEIGQYDLLKGEVFLVSQYSIPRHLGMWVLTYKTSCLRDSKLVMPEHMLYTDQFFCTIPFGTVQTMQVEDFCVYCYRIGRDGQSVSPEARIKHIDETVDICKKLTQFCATQTENSNYEYLKYRVSAYYCAALRALCLLPVNNTSLKRIKLFEKETKATSKDVFKGAEAIGGMGKLIKVFRITNYTTYWALKFVNKSKINWI